MDREEAINGYHRIFFKDPAKARGIIKKLKYKNDHNLLQMIAETYCSEAFFDEQGLKLRPDMRKLRYAENYIVKAFNIKFTCSNVLWTLAKVRRNYSQYEAAIFCYKEIIELGVRGISRDSCKNEMRVILAQINDSKFELYRLYHKTNPGLSKRYLTLYKQGLKKGIFSLYKPLKNYLLPELIGR